jgi:predicted nucleotidyltransferase
MDQPDFAAIAVTLYHSLQSEGFTVDGVILFGSYARKDAHSESDIDLAILSRHFGVDRVREGALVNLYAHRAHPKAEAIPISLGEWFGREFVSPVVHEIKKEGIFII